MDLLLSMQSAPHVTAFSSCRKSFSYHSSFLSPLPLHVPNARKCLNTQNHQSLLLTTLSPACGQGASSGSNIGMVKCAQQESVSNSKDESLAFVAGATGRVGSRTVRELLKLGFQVRAGVRSAQRAQSLMQSVQQLKLDDGASSASGKKPVDRLEIVECDLENDSIGPAIGNSSVVICCIGASEKEVFDVTGPYRIDYQATKKLIDAATVAKVDHFILLTSLGTNKIGFPASILNLFWGVLIWKRKAEEALIASGLPCTIVRPGGMERPTDAYKETHNLVLANEDTYFGGQVSNLQVAELMAFMAQNRHLSYCKIVEVIAEKTAPLTPMGELLSNIPSQRVDPSLKVESKPQDSPKSVASEAKAIVEKETTQSEIQKSRALSPYIAYEDLKPPTSPTPTPSTTPCTSEGIHVDVVKVEQKSIPEGTQTGMSESTTGAVDKELKQTGLPKQRPLSPYFWYEDLKPPSSPMPSPPSNTNTL